jgi:hypothetical protein
LSGVGEKTAFSKGDQISGAALPEPGHFITAPDYAQAVVETSGHALTLSRDCRGAHCDRDAEKGRDYCAACERKRLLVLCSRAAERRGLPLAAWAADVLEQAARAELAA